jgi:hypothetical protein
MGNNGNGNGPMSEKDKKALNLRIDEMNAMALAENLADLRQVYDLKFTALENDIATLRHLVASQSQIIGQALQNTMGAGSTVADPNPEDVR